MVQEVVHLSDDKRTVITKIEKLFSEKGWSTVALDEKAGRLTARTSATFLSWGEEVSVLVKPEDKGTRVSVESHPTAQLVDWERSKANVSTVLAFLKGSQSTAKR